MSHRKFNYGWVVAFSCFIMSFMVFGLGNSPLSLYIVPVTKQLGFSRGDFSIVFTLITFGTMVIQLFYGFFVNRFGVKNLMIFGAAITPLGYLVFYLADNLPIFYAGGILLGIAMAFASVTSISIIIHDWFESNQGTILGIIFAGSGLGGFLFSRVIGSYIAESGFKASFMFTAILLAAAALPVIFLTKSGPGERRNAGHDMQGGESHASNVKMSTGSFLKIPGMVTGILAVFFMGMAIHPVLINTPAYLVEKGFTSVFAAEVSATIFFVLAVAKLALGVVYDRLGIKLSMLLGLGSFILAVILLVLAKSPAVVWAFVAFDGVAVATLNLLVPLFAKAILGKENYSSYLGVFIAAMSAGVALGVPVISYGYDILGTYSTVIAAFAGLGALALVLALLSLKKAHTPPAAVEAQPLFID